MTEFDGWPRGALTFFKDLEANNEREWFKEHRPRYESLVREPAAKLGQDLADLGRPKLFRPFNDTRFMRSQPTPPIKEHIGLAVGYEGAGGFYVELSLDGLFLATGLHNPQSDQIARMREAMADGRKAAALRRAIATAEAGGMAINEPDMKRLPRGYDPDHRSADLLMRRRLVATRREKVGAWLSKPDCYDLIRSSLEAGVPLVKWIRNNVGPSEKTVR